jgi:hypothetical protein
MPEGWKQGNGGNRFLEILKRKTGSLPGLSRNFASQLP